VADGAGEKTREEEEVSEDIYKTLSSSFLSGIRHWQLLTPVNPDVVRVQQLLLQTFRDESPGKAVVMESKLFGLALKQVDTSGWKPKEWWCTYHVVPLPPKVGTKKTPEKEVRFRFGMSSSALVDVSHLDRSSVFVELLTPDGKSGFPLFLSKIQTQDDVKAYFEAIFEAIFAAKERPGKSVFSTKPPAVDQKVHEAILDLRDEKGLYPGESDDLVMAGGNRKDNEHPDYPSYWVLLENHSYMPAGLASRVYQAVREKAKAHFAKSPEMRDREEREAKQAGSSEITTEQVHNAILDLRNENGLYPGETMALNYVGDIVEKESRHYYEHTYHPDNDLYWISLSPYVKLGTPEVEGNIYDALITAVTKKWQDSPLMQQRVLQSLKAAYESAKQTLKQLHAPPPPATEPK